jgi:NADPH:quinone reductase-like Zn-dependent oxidoreductase
MSPSNEAAWLEKPGTPLKVGPAPFPIPQADEVVVQIQAVAINPMEAFMQQTGMLLQNFPAIIGCDGAGVVHSVGSAVTSFRPGDRVMAGFDGVPAFPTENHHRCSFQRYAVAKVGLTAKIPDAWSFTDATVLPLCLGTAADGLFSDHGMDLPAPKNGGGRGPNGKTILVWGGSSGVGTNAIQLLVAEGYEVGAVASKKNHELCQDLGAKHVFDQSSDTVVEDIARTFENTEFAGVFSCLMTKEVLENVVDVYVKTGSKGKIGSVLPPGMPLPVELPAGLEVTRCKPLISSPWAPFSWRAIEFLNVY